MKIVIGPYCSGSKATGAHGHLAPFDHAIEWSSPEQSHSIPLFRGEPGAATKLRWRHVLVRAEDLPCDVVCTEPHVVDAPEGTLVPLDALLAALYRSHEVSRPLRDVLGDLAAQIPLESPRQRGLPNQGLLGSEAETEGYRISCAVRQGDEVLASIAWKPQDSAHLFHVANCRFRVEQGLLAGGEWVQPQGEGGVAGLLADELRRLFPVSPTELLSPAGRAHLAGLADAG